MIFSTKSCSVNAGLNSAAPDIFKMDNIDRTIINQLQGGFPICEEPFAELSVRLGIDEDVLIDRIDNLLNEGVLSRFGPLYNVERMGGNYSLVAMRIPEPDLDRVTALINGFTEVAHNYEREHEFNIWFVLAVENQSQKKKILEQIEALSNYQTYDMPKLEEYYVGLKFDA